MTTDPNDTSTSAQPGPEGFYVTVRRGTKTGLLLGPHDTKEEADARVPLGKRLAEDVDSWTAFDAFGVTRLQGQPGDELPPGALNEMADQEAQ
jgi:hypothetical protein